MRFLVVALALAALALIDVPKRPVVPCSTDQDCAEKNPYLNGLYAFPEKGR